MIVKKRDNESAKAKYANYTPTLNTLIMVEETLKNMQDADNIAELKRKLPRQVNHYTLMKILEYLEESKKIAVSIKGIKWIYPLPVKKELQRGYIN